MYIILIIILSLVIIKLSFKAKAKKQMFEEIFEDNIFPACIIDDNNEIIWINQIFNTYFPKIKLKDNFLTIGPKKVLNQIKITQEKNEWLLKNFNLNNNFYGINFILTNKSLYKWWLDIPFPIVIINEDLNIEEVNYSFEDLIGVKVLNINIKNFLKKIDIDLSSKEAGQELLWQTQNGIFPIKTWIKDFSDKKIIFLENRIEFIKLKNKVQESQHLQILGKLASSIIHDFNNLLTCIMSFTESLEETIPNNDYLQEIRRNVEQAARLASELLNFIKDKPIEQKSVEPKTFIPKIAMMLQQLLGKSKITFEFVAYIEGLIGISETQFEQIILNMAINSKDAMPNGGIFKIHTYEQTFHTPFKIMESKMIKAGTYYAIEISDTGTGISPENIEKIFSPFFTTKTHGTGLGLASCMRIAEHNGGGIKFTTSKKGTIFTLYLPLIKKEQLTKNIDPIKKSIKKIILVEDEEIIRTLMKKALEEEKYEVQAFSNGAEALIAINDKTNIFDCLITDAVLPGVDGTQLANAARLRDKYCPIFLVSGYSFEDLNNKNLPENIKYIAKPFTIKSLKTQINEAFN